MQTAIHNILNSITKVALDIFSEARDIVVSTQEASKKQQEKAEKKSQPINQAG